MVKFAFQTDEQCRASVTTYPGCLAAILSQPLQRTGNVHQHALHYTWFQLYLANG